jgi:hypothetical protein
MGRITPWLLYAEKTLCDDLAKAVAAELDEPLTAGFRASLGRFVVSVLGATKRKFTVGATRPWYYHLPPLSDMQHNLYDAVGDVNA